MSSFILAIVYNPPKSPHEKLLLDHVAHTTTRLKARYRSTGFIVCGDFSNAEISQLADRQLRNVVKVPTRGSNCLDLIITNIANY